VTDDLVVPPSEASARAARRIMLIVAGSLLVFVLAVGGAVFGVLTKSSGMTEIVVGSWDTEMIIAATLLTCVVSVFVILCAIRVTPLWLLLFVPLRLASFAAIAIAMFLVALVDDNTVVPLLADGCRTGYVASERTPWRHTQISILRTDGLLATSVSELGSRGGGHPFADGDYRIESEGDTLRVWVGGRAEPSFELPVVADERSRPCSSP
jgi:hypothetical protein